MLRKIVIRMLICSFGLYLSAILLGDDKIVTGTRTMHLLIGGLVLAFVNATIKPLMLLLSLPVVLITLGAFMIVVNGLAVLIAASLYSPLQISSLGVAMIVGAIVGILNYLVSNIIDIHK